MHHLPTPQFSRLVTILAFDLTSPALDSMILAWDHIASRYLRRLESDRVSSGRFESIRLLSIHDAVHAIFNSGAGCIFNGTSSGTSVDAAMAAAAQASHDVLATVFTDSRDQIDLAISLVESLSLIGDEQEKFAGARTGAESAAAFAKAFSPMLQNTPNRAPKLPPQTRQATPRISLRLAKNPKWSFDWQRSA